MDYYDLKYSAKVWLSGLLVGPVIAVLSSFCIGGASGGSVIYFGLLIPPILCVVALLSCLTWLIFWGMVNLITNTVTGVVQQKSWITLAAILLSIGTLYVWFFDDVSLLENAFLPLVIGYSLGVTFGVWHCHLGNEINIPKSNSDE